MDISAAVAFKQSPLPDGVTYNHTSVDLIDSAGNVTLSQTIDPAIGTVTFTNITPGDYTILAQSFDSNGVELGGFVTVTISIAPIPVGTFAEPISVTLTLGRQPGEGND